MEHTFSFDVPGLIDLLGRRLHDHPSYLIRDLIQLAVDSIRARELLDADHSGSIVVEVLSGKVQTLAFLDDGLGLTEDEARATLGTIGGPSLGILSCFHVTDEVAVISKSARIGTHPAIEWRGRSDGTYSLRALDRDMQPGTQVYVTFKPEYDDLLPADNLLDWVSEFAECLSCPIRLVQGGETIDLARSTPPWRRRFTSTEQQTRELLNYGIPLFGSKLLDAVPFESKVGEIEGVAYVLPYASSVFESMRHVVCLNEIRLGDSVDWMLPQWADFVRCVVNIGGLQATTSGEGLIESDVFEEVRRAVGRSLRDYLVGVAARDTEKLAVLLEEHEDCLKALALEDDDFYRLMIDSVVFETSMGLMTLGEYRQRYPKVRYIDSKSDFQSIAPIASARGDCVLWAETDLEVDLLDRLPSLVEGAESEVQDLVTWLKPIKKSGAPENLAFRAFANRAEEALRPFSCTVTVESHRPGDPPALYRSAIAPLEPGILDMLLSEYPETSLASFPPFPENLTLNSRHPLIRTLASVQDRTVLSRVMEMLYLQAKLAGRYPLGPREMALVNGGLIEVLKDLIAR